MKILVIGVVSMIVAILGSVLVINPLVSHLISEPESARFLIILGLNLIWGVAVGTTAATLRWM